MLYRNTVYVFKYGYSVKMVMDSSRNMWQCTYIQKLVQILGDELVYISL